jgi:hypothetical protein
MRVSVALLFHRRMCMAMIIAASVRVSMGVRVTVVMVATHCEEAKQVDTKPDGRYEQ